MCLLFVVGYLKIFGILTSCKYKSYIKDNFSSFGQETRIRNLALVRLVFPASTLNFSSLICKVELIVTNTSSV